MSSNVQIMSSPIRTDGEGHKQYFILFFWPFLFYSLFALNPIKSYRQIDRIINHLLIIIKAIGTQFTRIHQNEIYSSTCCYSVRRSNCEIILFWYICFLFILNKLLAGINLFDYCRHLPYQSLFEAVCWVEWEEIADRASNVQDRPVPKLLGCTPLQMKRLSEDLIFAAPNVAMKNNADVNARKNAVKNHAVNATIAVKNHAKRNVNHAIEAHNRIEALSLHSNLIIIISLFL